VALDSAGNLYVADTGNQRIRKVSGGTITTVAGGGNQGLGDGGPATSASLTRPRSSRRFGWQHLHRRHKRLPSSEVAGGTITTVAGNGAYRYSGDGGPAISASLNWPYGVAVDSAGNRYIADTFGNRIRKVSGGTIATVAGNENWGFSGDGGPATSTSLYAPAGVAADSTGNLYIADTNNNRIRKVSGGTITTVAGKRNAGFSGDGGPATSASLWSPRAWL